MEWLTQQWVISVGGGVVSGLLVLLAVRHLFSGREQREYHQNVATANNEILHAIRPAIAEKIIPSNAMLDALFAATARKYGIDSRDLLPKTGFANELMKEVIDNAFLSSQQKVEFCELLSGMKQPDAETSRQRALEAVAATRRADSSDPSAILGLTTALTAFMMTVFFYLKDKEDFMMGGQTWKIVPMLAIVVIIPIIAYLLLDLIRQMARPRRETEEKNIAASKAGTPLMPRDASPAEGTPMQATP